MSAATLLAHAASAFALPAELFVAALLFARSLPRRPRFAGRVAGVLAAYAVLALVSVALFPQLVVDGYERPPHGLGPDLWSLLRMVGTVAVCGALLVSVAPALRACHVVDRWGAVFCAVCGYALQNFGSGLGELAGRLAGATGPTGAGLAYTLGGCVVSYVVFYLLLVRRVDPSALRSDANPLLATMTVATVVAVIGFDVVLKDADVVALPLATYAALRVAHGIVCVFVLVVNVAIVANGQLRSERDVARRVARERERHLAAARTSVEAVNARVHDIRHEVARTLAASGQGVDRALLASVIREIDIYDAPARTGNEVLDTVLTERALICSRDGISLTASADGGALATMGSADLYALVSLALDDAIAEARAAGPGRRSVSFTARRAAGMAQLHLECYAAKEPGAPAWHEPELRALVERNGGTLSLVRAGGTVSLDALLPSQEATD